MVLYKCNNSNTENIECRPVMSLLKLPLKNEPTLSSNHLGSGIHLVILLIEFLFYGKNCFHSWTRFLMWKHLKGGSVWIGVKIYACKNFSVISNHFGEATFTYRPVHTSNWIAAILSLADWHELLVAEPLATGCSNTQSLWIRKECAHLFVKASKMIKSCQISATTRSNEQYSYHN